MTAQDLPPAHYQIFSIIVLKEFIKLNVDIDIKIKHVKSVEVNMKIFIAVFNTQTLKMVY